MHGRFRNYSRARSYLPLSGNLRGDHEPRPSLNVFIAREAAGLAHSAVLDPSRKAMMLLFLSRVYFDVRVEFKARLNRPQL